LTPEEVAEGFIRLVRDCGNGSTVYIGKRLPYMEVPDYNKVPIFLLLTSLAWVVDKIAGPSVVKKRHHIMALSVFMASAFALVAWLF